MVGLEKRRLRVERRHVEESDCDCDCDSMLRRHIEGSNFVLEVHDEGKNASDRLVE